MYFKKTRRALALLLTCGLLLGLAAGCAPTDGFAGKYPDTDLELTDLELQDIAYEMCSYTHEDQNDMIFISGTFGGVTGQPVTAVVRDTSGVVTTHVYTLIDWGDGTWSYRGPIGLSIAIEMKHVYRKPGTYSVRAMSIRVADGSKTGFSPVYTYTITGEEVQGEYISTVEPISSGSVDDEHGAANIVDGTDSYWRSPSTDNIEEQQWVGLRLDSHYSLDKLEIKLPAGCDVFPQNPAIEYTTDGGETWYHLRRYYYLEDHQKGKFNPVMGFPNLQGGTLVLDLDGVVANGIRISSKLFPIKRGEDGTWYFGVEEMRVSGNKRPLYYSSYGGQFDADVNNMWLTYGTAAIEPSLYGLYWGNSLGPYEGGSIIMTVTEWYEWDIKQIAWTDYQQALDTFTARLFETKVGPDDWGNYGYVWQDPADAKHMAHQAHYDTNSIFIIAVRDYLLQRNDPKDVLSVRNSQGLSLNERLDIAMQYLLGPLKGAEGLILIGDPANNGTAEGNASSYWDAYTHDGYLSSFVNIMFYAALEAMADIELYRGNTESSAYFTSLAAITRDRINATFWDAEKGRYIMSIDVNGEKHDYGTTYMNVSAIAYGVASDEQAAQIYSWLDGERIIEGDTSTGEDIYAFKYAPRANTVDVIKYGPPYCWETWSEDSSVLVGYLDPTEGGAASYGHNIQNGGTIFYSSYYDMMGRLKSLGINNAMQRFTEILDEFHIDQIRRRTIYSIATEDGVTGEFPESGLVPLFFQDGIVGVSTEIGGIRVKPNLPDDMDYAGVREYHYAGQQYSIKVTRNIDEPKVEAYENLIYVQIPADGAAYLIHADNTVEKLG